MALLKFFKYDLLITLAALIGAAFYGGIVGMVSAAILIVLEIVFSFDNAGVNAKYLDKMSHAWRNIFLTVGVLVAVFGMRLIFPFLIVCLAGNVGPVEAWNLAMDAAIRIRPEPTGTFWNPPTTPSLPSAACSCSCSSFPSSSRLVRMSTGYP